MCWVVAGVKLMGKRTMDVRHNLRHWAICTFQSRLWKSKVMAHSIICFFLNKINRYTTRNTCTRFFHSQCSLFSDCNPLGCFLALSQLAATDRVSDSGAWDFGDTFAQNWHYLPQAYIWVFGNYLSHRFCRFGAGCRLCVCLPYVIKAKTLGLGQGLQSSATWPSLTL